MPGIIRAKKGLVVTYNNHNKYKSEGDKIKQNITIFLLLLMTLAFVAIKISCFVMMCKFVFQEENNLFGFPVKMFSFLKTNWSIQYPDLENTTSSTNTLEDN